MKKPTIDNLKKLSIMLCLVFLFSTCNVFSQNLIINPSFEDTSVTIIPSKKFNETYVEGNKICEGWFQATQSSSDFFNSNQSTVPLLSLCLARTGQGRAGIITGHGKSYFAHQNQNSTTTDYDYSEYLSTRLKRPLYKDSVYEISFYIALHKSSKKFNKKLGFILSDTIIKKAQKTHLKITPSYVCDDESKLKSTTEWKRINTSYKAKGGEQYLTIGKFNDDDYGYVNETASLGSPLERIYYYLDDVCVVNTQDTAVYYEKVRQQELSKNHFVYLIDASASMLAGNNYYLMQQQVKKQIALLSKYDKVSLFAFSEKPQAVLKNIKATDTTFIFNTLKNIPINGITKLDDGLQASIDFLSKQYVANASNQIIIATDGLFKIKKDFRKIISKQTSDKQIGISTIYLGKKTNKGLEKLCRKNSGYFMPIKSNNTENNIDEFKRNCIFTSLQNINAVQYNNKAKGNTEADFGY